MTMNGLIIIIQAVRDSGAVMSISNIKAMLDVDGIEVSDASILSAFRIFKQGEA